MGCGPGTITNAMVKVFAHSHATGVDISEAAIAYAKTKYPSCDFVCMPITAASEFSKKFDMIHCREFYPFTRTSDLGIHREYLEFCSSHLADEGALVITLADREESILDSIREGKINYRELRLTEFRMYGMSIQVLRKYFPSALSFLGSRMIRFILKRKGTVALISRKTG